MGSILVNLGENIKIAALVLTTMKDLTIILFGIKNM